MSVRWDVGFFESVTERCLLMDVEVTLVLIESNAENWSLADHKQVHFENIATAGD